jgi:hypothetical protein
MGAAMVSIGGLGLEDIGASCGVVLVSDGQSS